MKHEETISPDDPRLTAYALGELDEPERAKIEAALAHDAAARATVEAVRALAEQMSTALAIEPMEELSTAAEGGREVTPDGEREERKRDSGGGALIRFPQFYYVVSGLAAACFVAFMALRAPDPARPEKTPQKIYREIALTPVALPVAEVMENATAVPAVEPAAFGSAETSPPVRLADGKLSLLSQIMDASRDPAGSHTWSFRAPSARESRLDAVVAAEPVGKMAAQPVVLRTFASSQDENRIVEARVKREVPRNFSRGLADSRLAGPGAFFYSAPPWPKTDGLALFSVPKAAALTAEVAPSTEAYAYVRDSDFLAAGQNPFSTFSIDVDTASYANVRRFLQNGQRPPRDAVRIEEMINYFPYRYAGPAPVPGGGTAPPLTANFEVAEAPWAAGHRLVRIGLKGREVAMADRPAANLVFLLDVSGSMNDAKKLPLVKESLRLLVGQLRAEDRVAIVTYAGHSGLALPSTPVAKAREILAALDGLTPGGSTNGEMGIQLAYDIAKANFVTGGVNRVILCTDGDFNVGAASEEELARLIGEKAKTGVFLTALGFGMGNLKDETLEKLADKGNGTYGYIDSRREAEKLLVQEVNGTLLTIAKDVKIQVDFNPARVASYRLIGYENRLLKKEDFNDDSVDAGEIGAGHTMTALYEIVPVGVDVVRTGPVGESKYATTKTATVSGTASGELLTVKLRYKEPAGDVSRKVEFPLTDGGATFAATSADFKFAAAVASFGMILRDSPHKGTATLEQVGEWAAAGTVDDAGGWRNEFVGLVRDARRVLL